jgi:hypothetical protein
MQEHDRPARLGGFFGELRAARITADEPPYDELERIADEDLGMHSDEGVRYVRLARATTAEILGGKRKRAPKWAWVLTYVTALHVHARNSGIDPALIGSIDEWRRKHAAVNSPAPVPLTVAAIDDRGQADAQMQAFLALLGQGSEPRGRHSGREIAPGWLELHLTLESNAVFIRTSHTELVPGLLQTEGYASAVIALHQPDATPEEIARLARQRMQRRLPHRHHESLRVWALIGEEALRNPSLDPAVIREQVEFLIRLSDEPRVTIQVVPAGSADSGSLTLFRFPERFLGDWACLEQQPDQATFLYEREDVELYARRFADLAVRAATPGESQRILQEILNRI